MSRLFLGAAHAAVYSKYRPTTPACLIEKVIEFLKEKIPGPLTQALDVGCGSGQSTLILAPYFKNVLGTDVSENQLKEAELVSKNEHNLQFKCAPAEETPLSAGTVQLITASQCFHWFNHERFYEDAKRILVPNGVVALFGYTVPKMVLHDDSEKTKKLGDLIDKHYEYMGPFFAEQRHYIDSLYSTIKFPFADEYRDENILTSKQSTVADYLGYLTTWSPYQTILKEDPKNAETLMNNFAKGVADILQTDDFVNVVLDVEIQYFLVMGRNS